MKYVATTRGRNRVAVKQTFSDVCIHTLASTQQPPPPAPEPPPWDGYFGCH